MRSRLLWLSSMALALVACSGAGSSSPSNDGGVPSSNDRDATADARARDATSDASRESAVACASDPAPPNIDSTARIHFVLTNTSPSPRYVLSGAARCEAFSIDGVRMSVPFSCGCECPPPADQMHFTPIAPGASITLDWNAYRIVLYESRESCSDWGRPDVCASYTFGAYQAVAAGDYEARFMVAESALVPDAGSSVCSGHPTSVTSATSTDRTAAAATGRAIRASSA